MRSLRYLYLEEAHLQDECLTATAWDPVTNSIICTFGPTEDDAAIFLKRKTTLPSEESPTFSLIASWDAPCPLPHIPCDAVVALQYLADTLSTCIVLAGGDIVIVREDPQLGEDKIEIVGSVDVGITAAAWAPDEELLVLTTRAGTLLYMTRDFENVASVSFSAEDLQASTHVSMGWGKVETQFKGKRARSLRDPTIPETVEEGKLDPIDDGRVSISWRGDGSFVAVNSVDSEVRRVIRVYSRDGTLDSVSEPVDRLTGGLSWRPAGNLIAGIQRFERRVDVVFFERNGLRHGQFSLRLSEEDMRTWASDIELYWNISSTTLAVCFRDRVQMWTMGNYHYYLKQEIPLPVNKGIQGPLLCTWHLEKQLRVAISSRGLLYALTQSGYEFLLTLLECLLDIEFVFEVIRGTTIPPNDSATVLVIDGKVLKLTPFKAAVIPPPFAFSELIVDGNIIDAALSSSGRQIAVLTKDKTHIFEWDPMSKPVGKPVPLLTAPIPNGVNSTYETPKSLLDHLHRQGLQEIRSRMRELSSWTTETGVDLDAPISESTYGNGAENFDTATAQWALGDPSDSRFLWNRRIFHVVNGAQNKHEDTLDAKRDIIEINFKESGRLTMSKLAQNGEKIEEKLIATNANSFVVTGDHLVYATTNSLLKFVHLTNLEDLEIPLDAPDVDERCRNIECGAIILTVCSTDYSVYLQMPRGNIETIYPRALVVPAVRRFLDQHEYGSAIEVCRKHMVDMNILHDYDPVTFKSNVPKFVTQLRPIDMDEFLMRLKEEDVSLTLYKDTLSAGLVEKLAIETLPMSKVNRICDLIIEYLLEKKPESYWRNLVTAYVCKSPPDLESALRFIRELPEDVTLKNAAELKREAISLIVIAVDVNQLFDTAIGLYDLEFAVTLAQEAQKDPKEYLPWIRSLQNEPELRRWFLIDDHLKRYKKALGWLVNLRSYEEMLQYIVNHALYQEGLEHCKYMPNEHLKIQVVHAQYLFKNLLYKDAAIVYESVELYTDASEAYAKANLWRESLNCASASSDSTPESVRSLASSLAQTMTEIHDYTSVATIFAEYLEDIPQAAKFLCRAFRFADGIALLKTRGFDTSHLDIITSGLAEAMATMIELLADCKGQLNAQVPRIHELRAAKASDPVAYYDHAGNVNAEGADVPDDVSVAPTNASTAGVTLFTRYTNVSSRSSSSRKTSRNRRREERKRASGKRGTIYEEEYLVASVGRLIDRVNSVNEDVGRLVAGLASRGKHEEAKAVRNAIKEVVEMCHVSTKEVFQVDNPEGAARVRPSGGDGVFFDIEEEQRHLKGGVPAVKDFEGFSFLGK